MKKEHIGKYLSIARRAQTALLDKKLKPCGISHAQIMLLIALIFKNRNRGFTQNKFCLTVYSHKYNWNRHFSGNGKRSCQFHNLLYPSGSSAHNAHSGAIV